MKYFYFTNLFLLLHNIVSSLTTLDNGNDEDKDARKEAVPLSRGDLQHNMNSRYYVHIRHKQLRRKYYITGRACVRERESDRANKTV